MGGSVPGGQPGGGPPGGGLPLDPCNAPACVGARANLSTARSDFKNACDRLRYVKNWLDALKPIVTISLTVIIVLIVIAALLGLLGLWFLAIILWVLILIYAISYVVYLGLARAALSLAQALDTDLQTFEDAVRKVVANCPESCQGDLSPPTCDVSYP